VSALSIFNINQRQLAISYMINMHAHLDYGVNIFSLQVHIRTNDDNVILTLISMILKDREGGLIEKERKAKTRLALGQSQNGGSQLPMGRT
jgi:predicted Zn-dependent peptidase